jgi:hypothetical protein
MAAHQIPIFPTSSPALARLESSAVKQALPRKRQVKKLKTNKISVEWQNKD